MTKEICYRHQKMVGQTVNSFCEPEFSHPKTIREKKVSLNVMPSKEAMAI